MKSHSRAVLKKLLMPQTYSLQNRQVLM